jgi:5'-nucleotidase/UDP-sugar diphosphatase
MNLFIKRAIKQQAVKRAVYLVAVLFVFVPCIMANPVREQQATVTIVHTNDVHSNAAVEPYVKGYVDSLRAENRPVVLVSAGDAFDGTPFASLSKGMDVATVMNMTGYEVFTMGNHEQFPVVEFQNIAPRLKFPVLAANISDSWRQAVPAIQDYVIKNVGGVNVAFIGITTGTTGDESVAALERSRRAAEMEGTDIYIGVVHLGVQDPDETIRSTYLAEHCPWLAVIIDGHCHTVHEEGLICNGVLIAETGEYGNNIGVIEITVKNKQVVSKTARVIPIKGHEAETGITPDTEVQAFIDKANALNAVYLDETVFTLPIPLQGTRNPNRRVESYFGDLLMDALRWKTNADVAVFPGPGFRADLPAGPITRGQLATALYLDMPVCTVDVSGGAIYEMLEQAVSAYPNENNFFVQQSGMRIEFNQNAPAGQRILSVTMSDGSPLDRERVYSYTSKSDSLWVLPGGEDPYIGNSVIAEYTLCDVFIEYINSGVEVTGQIDNRTKSVE